MAERKLSPTEWEALHSAGFPAFVRQALRRCFATSEAAAVTAAELGNLLRTMELEGAPCRRPPAGFNSRLEAVPGVRQAPSNNPTVARYYLDETLLPAAAAAQAPLPAAPAPAMPAALTAAAIPVSVSPQRAASPRRLPPSGGGAGAAAGAAAAGAAPATAPAPAAVPTANAAAAVDWAAVAGPSDPAQSVFLRTVLPGEPPFTQLDVDRGFLDAARARVQRIIDSAQDQRWVPLHGRTIIATPVGGDSAAAAANGSGGGGDQQRTFEVCLSRPLDGGTPRVGADGSLTNVYLGRWAPPVGFAARPPAVVSAAGGYVAVKVVTLPPTSRPGAGAADARLPFSEALAAQWASDAQGSSWSRLYLSLVDAFSEDGRGTTPPKVVLVMELALATLHERLRPPPRSGLEAAVAAGSDGTPVPFPLYEREAHYSAYAVVRSVRYLHRGMGRGVSLLHRDIAPRNVFYTWDGSLVLGDFGLTKELARPQPAQQATAAGAASIGGGGGGGATAMPTQLQVAELGTATVAQLHRLTLNPREVYQAAMVGAAAAAATPAATPTAPHSARSVTPPPPQPPQPSSSRRGATMTETTDVFLAGQTLFYVFSGGYFPFVDVDARDAQACHRAAVASGAEPRWEYLHPLTPPAMVALLAWMLEHDPTKRPPISLVVEHPAFASLGELSTRIKEAWIETYAAQRLPGHPVTAALRGMATAGYDGVPLLRPAAVLPDGAVDASRAEKSVVERLPVADRVRTWYQRLDATATGCMTALVGARGLPATAVDPNTSLHGRFNEIPALRHPRSAGVGLLRHLRNWLAHVSEHTHSASGLARAAAVADPYAPRHAPRWAHPTELVVRHPDAAWLWPALWRRLATSRRALLARGDANLVPFLGTSLGVLKGLSGSGATAIPTGAHAAGAAAARRGSVTTATLGAGGAPNLRAAVAAALTALRAPVPQRIGDLSQLLAPTSRTDTYGASSGSFSGEGDGDGGGYDSSDDDDEDGATDFEDSKLPDSDLDGDEGGGGGAIVAWGGGAPAALPPPPLPQLEPLSDAAAVRIRSQVDGGHWLAPLAALVVAMDPRLTVESRRDSAGARRWAHGRATELLTTAGGPPARPASPAVALEALEAIASACAVVLVAEQGHAPGSPPLLLGTRALTGGLAAALLGDLPRVAVRLAYDAGAGGGGGGWAAHVLLAAPVRPAVEELLCSVLAP